MAKQKIPATQRGAERATEPGRYRFDRGLYLNVTRGPGDSVRKSWVQCLTLPDGTRATRGLGPLHDVTVEDAIHLAHQNRRAVRIEKRDPFTRRRKQPPAPTFAEAAEAVMRNRAPNWTGRTGQDQRKALEKYAMPKLGDMRVNVIRARHVQAVLASIWTDKPAVARRVRSLIREALDWAVAHDHCTDNPAGPSLDSVLPKANGRKVEHVRAVPHEEVRDALRTVEASRAAMATKLSLTFLVHTAARNAEVREARWDEFEVDFVQRTGTWTIPASRTKMDREHKVPLSVQAVAIIEQARQARGRGRPGLVFATRRGEPVSETTFVRLLNGLRIDGTAHGFRSSFSSWCADNDKSEDLREAALV